MKQKHNTKETAAEAPEAPHVSPKRPRETALGYQRRIADTTAAHEPESAHKFIPDSRSNSLNCERCGESREEHWKRAAAQPEKSQRECGHNDREWLGANWTCVKCGDVKRQPQAAPRKENAASHSPRIHSPLPWKQGERTNAIVNSCGVEVVWRTTGSDEQWKHDAAFIVTACNMHEQLMAERDELLAALKAARSWMGRKPEEDEITTPYKSCFRGLLERMEAAIAKAEGSGQ